MGGAPARVRRDLDRCHDGYSNGMGYTGAGNAGGSRGAVRGSGAHRTPAARSARSAAARSGGRDAIPGGCTRRWRSRRHRDVEVESRAGEVTPCDGGIPVAVEGGEMTPEPMLSDEDLNAFADGQLSPEREAQV